MRSWRFAVGLLAALLSVALVMSCAEERDPINRVQPNVVKKAMLKGEWYYHMKVVDVPGGMPEGFLIPGIVGWYSDPERVAFDIQERFLYVRRTNELVQGGETYSSEFDEDFSTYAVMAAFRISSHFDIQRDYNPVTGESMNVVSENTYDRPWWEREYMRVDWSENLAPGYNFFFQHTPAEPLSYYVQDECTPDQEFAADPEDRCVPDPKAPFFDITWNESGDNLVRGYFDITTAAVVRAGMTYLGRWGYEDVPTCWMYDVAECVDTIYFTRNSFWKIVDEEHDYEPMPYKGAVTDQMGFFYSEYLTYDQQETVTEPNREVFIQRHNIWEQSHSWNDPNGEGINWSGDVGKLFDPSVAKLCHSTSDCCADYDPNDPLSEASCNSVCDVYTDLRVEDRTAYEEAMGCKFRVIDSDLVQQCEPTHYCTLPYTKRRVRPILYYTNKEWPEELNHHPSEPGVSDDKASQDAWAFAYADQPDETRSMMEQVSDRWSAPYVRTINIMKKKAAGTYQADLHANVPYIDDDFKRTEGKLFAGIGHVPDTIPEGGLGFDDNWYDPERPPYAICRFSPVLGPGEENDPNGDEPDVCWERVQEMSRCVFDPENPGINPKTGREWTEASEWPICTEREATPRLGDIRYGVVWWVDKWYGGGFRLLGLGPGHSDMVNGETLAGAAHLYMHNDMAARRIVDTAMLVTGDMDPQDFIDGYNLVGWHNKWTGSGVNPESNTANALLATTNKGYSLGQMASAGAVMNSNLNKVQKFDLDYEAIDSSSDTEGLPAHGPGASYKDGAVKLVPYSMDQLLDAAQAQYASVPNVDPDAMIRSIASSPEGASIESNLLNVDNAQTFLAANGFHPESNWQDDSELMDALLITRKGPFEMHRSRNAVKNWISQYMNGDFATGFDEAAFSFAYEVQRLRREGRLPTDSGETFRNALWRLARKKLMRAVTAHEIGHSVGLRHNFGGSQDYINYRERYWEVRTNGCADAEFDGLAPDLDDYMDTPGWDDENHCNNPDPLVGPRYVKNYENIVDGQENPWDGDPISQYEIYNKLHHAAYSSVMDYSAAYHLDEDGIGRYEWAALLYGYGHHFEVYKSTPNKYWQFYDGLRPSTVTADCVAEGYGNYDECRGMIIDMDRNQALLNDPDLNGILDGALVVNLKTGEESNVAVGGLTDDYIMIDPPFAEPLNKGDGYAVWGHTIANLPGDHVSLTGFGFKDMLDSYQGWSGNPFLFFLVYPYVPHYTEFYRQWTGTDDVPTLGFNKQENREVRDIRLFDWRVSSQNNRYEPGFNLLSDAAVRVPYAYCTDNSAGISNDCNRRDYGADDWERMHHHIVDWEQWYITRSFIRGRVDYTPDDYFGGYYDRIYQVPKNFNNIYALYLELLGPLYGEREKQAMVMDPWNSWAGYTMALHDGFNMLMTTLATPDPMAAYTPSARPSTGEWGLVGDPFLGDGTHGIDIAQGGRIFETRYGNYNYDNECGQFFWRCLWNVGWYYDKVMALQGLTESATYFVGRDTAHDVRLYRVSFFDNFNWQLKNIFSGMMGEDWTKWAPMVISNQEDASVPVLYADQPILPLGILQPKMFWRDWANPVNDITNPVVFSQSSEIPDEWKAELQDPDSVWGTTWTPLDPMFNFTIQVYAMVLGMARFQHNYDLSFYQMSRMWMSEGDAIDSAREDYVTYYDPQINATFSALNSYGVYDEFHPFTTDETVGEGLAAAMINAANKIRSRSSYCDELDLSAYPTANQPIGMETPGMQVDDCCDDPYAVDYPLTDNWPTGVACLEDAECVPTEDYQRQVCIGADPEADPQVYGECQITDDCEFHRSFGDPADLNETELLAARARIASENESTDKSLADFRALLQFQVRLTKVYDTYMGFVGPEGDPGAVPEEE